MEVLGNRDQPGLQESPSQKRVYQGLGLRAQPGGRDRGSQCLSSPSCLPALLSLARGGGRGLCGAQGRGVGASGEGTENALRPSPSARK